MCGNSGACDLHIYCVNNKGGEFAGCGSPLVIRHSTYLFRAAASIAKALGRIFLDSDKTKGKITVHENGQYGNLQEKFNSPIIDPTVVSLKYAEMMVPTRDI